MASSGKPTKIMILQERDGTSQTGAVLGKVQIGDWVKVHYKAKIVSSGKEFLDTYMAANLTQFQIKEDGAVEYDGLYRGLNECVRTMILGEEARFIIPAEFAFGEQGLTKALIMKSNGKQRFNPDHVNRNPCGVSLLPVGPNEDIKIDIALMKVARDGTWHYRAAAKENKKSFWGSLLNGGFHNSTT